MFKILMLLICCLKLAMKKSSNCITLLVEYVKDGVYHREYKTFTKKEYKKMLKKAKKE